MHLKLLLKAAAVIHIRVQKLSGKFIVRTLAYKSRVVPLIMQSIPCLDLCELILLSELISSTLYNLDHNIGLTLRLSYFRV